MKNNKNKHFQSIFKTFTNFGANCSIPRLCNSDVVDRPLCEWLGNPGVRRVTQHALYFPASVGGIPPNALTQMLHKEESSVSSCRTKFDLEQHPQIRLSTVGLTTIGGNNQKVSKFVEF